MQPSPSWLQPRSFYGKAVLAAVFPYLLLTAGSTLVGSDAHSGVVSPGPPGSRSIRVSARFVRDPSALDWGTLYPTMVAIDPAGIRPTSSSTVFYVYPSDGFRYRTGGNTWFNVSLSLPPGALVQSMAAEVCDYNSTVDVSLFFEQDQVLGSGTVWMNTTSGAPGCGLFTLAIPDVTVDNTNYHYSAGFELQASDASTRFGSLRVFYRLQVSPPPATATFTDVPVSHPFFQYVEALAASGITSGCTATKYCPNAPITRGQMAVFLAKALGLYWPG